MGFLDFFKSSEKSETEQDEENTWFLADIMSYLKTLETLNPISVNNNIFSFLRNLIFFEQILKFD